MQERSRPLSSSPKALSASLVKRSQPLLSSLRAFSNALVISQSALDRFLTLLLRQHSRKK